MYIYQSIILGAIQGITEFLPISSSGHLVLLQNYFNMPNNIQLLYDTTVHFATLIAVIIFFYKDLYYIILGAFQELKDKNFGVNIKLIIYIIVSMIPAGIVGLLFEEKIENIFSSPNIVYINFFITSTLLLLTKFFQDKAYIKMENIGVIKSFLIGIAQAIAILPGISRSGSTISTAIFLKINKEDAAKFSFIMSIPVILGAFLLQLKDIENFNILFSPIIISGFFSALFFGLLSLKFLTFIIRKRYFHVFAYYLLALIITKLAM